MVIGENAGRGPRKHFLRVSH